MLLPCLGLPLRGFFYGKQLRSNGPNQFIHVNKKSFICLFEMYCSGLIGPHLFFKQVCQMEWEIGSVKEKKSCRPGYSWGELQPGVWSAKGGKNEGTSIVGHKAIGENSQCSFQSLGQSQIGLGLSKGVQHKVPDTHRGRGFLSHPSAESSACTPWTKLGILQPHPSCLLKRESR